MEDPVELLKELIRIDTTNPPGAEAALLDCLERKLAKAQLPFARQETAPGRGNLVSRLKADGEITLPPLVLLSHTDVVAADPSQWLYPPFEAREDEKGFIYGRGAVDTKQLTAMELCAYEALAKTPGRCRDVYFLATCDEESGSTYGLQAFLKGSVTLEGETLRGEDILRSSDVISEGGGFPILAGGKLLYLCESGQKGCGTVRFTVKARKAKGPFFGSGDGMARAMALAEDIGSTLLEERTLETVKAFEERLAGAALSPMMEKILLAMKHNTMTVTMVSGKNVNTVQVTCDVRLLPGYGRDYLEGVLEKLAQKWDCDYEILSLSQGYEANPESTLLGQLERATQEALGDPKAQILPFVSMGSSDGRFLTGLGARVYGYSPVYLWDMTFDTAVTMVHGVNERIHKDSVRLGTEVLSRAAVYAVKEEIKND